MIEALRAEGLSLRAIAARLTEQGVDTARGGRWEAAQVRGVFTEGMGFMAKYDVAISFLASDEPIAKELYTRLEGLNVFFFPRNQEELAGTDGLESMRSPFINSRVAVVLFRDRWGNTPWTGVEAQAIKDQCLGTQFRGLLFVQLEKSARHPEWLPQTHVRFNMSDFGMEQLVGAIKARVVENGGQIEPLDAISKAKRVKAEADYLAARTALMHDMRWIADNVHQAIRDALAKVVELVREVNAQSGHQIKAGTNGSMVCVLRSDWISMRINWRQAISNSLFDEHGQDCGLQVAECAGIIPIPNERIDVFSVPRVIRVTTFKPDISLTGQFVLKEVGRPGVISPNELPDRLVSMFLEFMAKAARGEVEPPSI